MDWFTVWLIRCVCWLYIGERLLSAWSQHQLNKERRKHQAAMSAEREKRETLPERPYMFDAEPGRSSVLHPPFHEQPLPSPSGGGVYGVWAGKCQKCQAPLPKSEGGAGVALLCATSGLYLCAECGGANKETKGYE